MSLYRHPDPAIEAWLADGPATLSAEATMAIKSGARALRQRREATIPWPTRAQRPMLIAAAALLVAAATLALAVGGPVWFAPGPQPSETASPSVDASLPIVTEDCFPIDDELPSHQPIGRAAFPSAELAIDYALPASAALTISMEPGLLHFSAGRTHGLLVVDVTEAIRHGSLVDQPPLGTDAASFLSELEKPFEYRREVIDFDVNGATSTTLGGRPGWSATVSMSAEHSSWTHIDRTAADGTGRGCAMEFDVPHRLIVVDVGSLVVAVQPWAASEQELAQWLPEAMQIAEALRLSEVSPAS